jgi:hypothetical protein
VFGELSVLLDQPHTADVRALEASQFHVADAAAILRVDPIALLYVATVLAQRLDSANRGLLELKRQVQAGESHACGGGGFGWRTLLPFLRRAPVVAAVGVGAYVGSVVATLAALHPLEYVAMNTLVGGTRGAYDRFELDYWSAAATEALRRLERRLDHDASLWAGETVPRILICIGEREERVHPLLRRPWIVEADPDQANFIIATQRSRCAENKSVVLIDEVKRFDRTFAWIYAGKE